MANCYFLFCICYLIFGIYIAMCLAIPGQVTRIRGRQVWVQYPGQTRKALLAEEGVKIGDWVMVQMGLVARILPPKEAAAMLAAWKS